MFKYYLIFALVIAIDQVEVESFISKPIVDNVSRLRTKPPQKIKYPTRASVPDNEFEPNQPDNQFEPNQPDNQFEGPDGNPAQDKILAVIKQLQIFAQDVINNLNLPNVKSAIGSLLKAGEAFTELGGVNFIGQIKKFLERILNGNKLKLSDLGLLGDISKVILSTLTSKDLKAFFALIGTPFKVDLDSLKAVFKKLGFSLESINVTLRNAIISVLRTFDRSVFKSGFNNVVDDLIQFLKSPNINPNSISQLLNKLFGNHTLTAKNFHDLKLHLFPMIKSNPNGVINALSLFKIPNMVASSAICSVFKSLNLILKPFPNSGKLFANLVSKLDFNSIQNPKFVRNKLKSL